MTLAPGAFRVFFASGKDLSDPASELHTNFKLSGSGEYLGLRDELGVVVHEFDEYPDQMPDISFGVGQSIDKTEFVSVGDTASYLVPGGTPGAWTTPGFDDSGWTTGDTALGYTDTVPGFAVWNYKANTAIGSLDTALQVIDTPSMQSAVFSENAAVFNYFNSDGHGHYTANETDFPGAIGAEDDFVVRATGIVTIPTAGDWTFGVNSDDGFRMDIGANRVEFPGTRGASDTQKSARSLSEMAAELQGVISKFTF